MKETNIVAKVNSNGKIRIPSKIVREAGFVPKEIVELNMFQNSADEFILYCFGDNYPKDLDEFLFINSKKITVASDNSITFTVGNNLLMPVISATDRWIEVF